MMLVSLFKVIVHVEAHRRGGGVVETIGSSRTIEKSSY
jgi:hypothetical protein